MLTQKQLTNLSKPKSILPLSDYVFVRQGWATRYSPDDNIKSISYKVDMGDCTLPLKEFKKIASKLNSPVFSETNGKTSVKDGTRIFVFETGLDDDDLPTLPKPSIEVATISGQDFKSFAKYCTDDDLRPAMLGVDYSGHGICATNAHQMKFDRSKTFDTPFRIHKDFARVCGVENYAVHVLENCVLLVNESEMIEMRLQDERFPDWTAVIPDKFDYTFEDKVYNLNTELELAMTMANSVTNRIKFADGKIIGEDEALGTRYEQEYKIDIPFSFAFNGRLFSEILKDIGKADVKIEMIAANRAAQINGEYILMPVMID